MDMRRILTLLLLSSLAFELAFAGRGHGYYEDQDGHKGKHGKAKGYHAHKGNKKTPSPPAIPIYVPPVEHSHDEPATPPTPSSSPPPPPFVADEPSAPPPSYVDTPAAPPTSSPITVGGVVLCQNCNYVGTSYYSYGKPLSGAIVRLACESTGEVKAKTNERGKFNLQVPNYASVVEDCKVYLVSSSQSTCNTPTDINDGISGSPIRSQKNYEGEVQYISGPLVFAPTYCRPTPPPLDNSPPKPNW